MLVEIRKPERLQDLETKTGISAEALVNQILDIHLDEEEKGKFLAREINKAFDLYKKKHKKK